MLSVRVERQGMQRGGSLLRTRVCLQCLDVGHCRRHGQASRPISTRQLKPLLALHTGPINVVVYHGSLGRLSCGRHHLEAGFTLRCFQRLSLPNVATQLCHWRDNWCTRGSSIPVLSY